MTRNDQAEYERLFEEACDVLADSPRPGRDALDRWSALSPMHGEAMQAAREIWDGAGLLKRAPWPTKAEIAADASDDDWLDEDESPPGYLAALGALKRPAFMRAALFSVAAIACVGGGVVLAPYAAQIYSRIATLNPVADQAENARYSTAVGEHHLVKLSDGSQFTLGGKSVARTAYTAGVRLIYLDEGEAFFDVAKDPSRPFIVSLGDAQVEAIGTEFNINRNKDSAVISVVEGVVQAIERPSAGAALRRSTDNSDARRAVELSGGERASYTRADGLSRLGRIDPISAVSWKTGTLAFSGERLGSVIGDINRYSARRIVINDARVASLRFSGTVHTDSIDEWLIAVEGAFGLEAYETDRQSLELRLRNERGSD